LTNAKAPEQALADALAQTDAKWLLLQAEVFSQNSVSTLEIFAVRKMTFA